MALDGARWRRRPTVVTVLFDVVFGAFALSMVVIAFLAVRWGVRRDRTARRAGSGPGSGRPSTPGVPPS